MQVVTCEEIVSEYIYSPFVSFILYVEALPSVHRHNESYYPDIPSCHVILYIHGFRKRGVGVVEDIRHSLKRVSRANGDEWELSDLHAKATLNAASILLFIGV
jgi:hypothetical protein